MILEYLTFVLTLNLAFKKMDQEMLTLKTRKKFGKPGKNLKKQVATLKVRVV